MKTRTIHLKNDEVIKIDADGVTHLLVMLSADGEWIGLRMRPANYGISHGDRAAEEIERALDSV